MQFSSKPSTSSSTNVESEEDVDLVQQYESTVSDLDKQSAAALDRSRDTSVSAFGFRQTDTFRKDLWEKEVLAEIERRKTADSAEEDYILEELNEVLGGRQLSEDATEDEITLANEEAEYRLEQLEKRDISKFKWLRHSMAVKGLPPKIKRKLYGPQDR